VQFDAVRAATRVSLVQVAAVLVKAKTFVGEVVVVVVGAEVAAEVVVVGAAVTAIVVVVGAGVTATVVVVGWRGGSDIPTPRRQML
jgi:hypothetical protein